ncbi:skin secretory protein xP2-like [Prinia subflava]|uniref:skin secretory protein xP2-like n=1 Tax=Prinia subflava TaxID=208062 RepID=UPI002FE0BD83
MDFLSSALTLEAARLLVVWRKIDLFFREMNPASSEIAADSRSDAPSPVVGGRPQRGAAAVSDVGFPSELDPPSPRSEDSFPPPPAAALEDLSLSDSDFQFLGDKGGLSPPRPLEQRGGGAPQSSRPAPPIPAPRRRRAGVGEPFIQASPALTGGEEPTPRPPPLVEHDSITMLCPNCGTSTTYPLDTSEVELPSVPPHLGAEGGALGAPAPLLQSLQGADAAGGGVCVGFSPAPALLGGQSVHSLSGGLPPAIGRRGLGETLLSGIPDRAAAGSGKGGAAPIPAPFLGSPPPAPAAPVVLTTVRGEGAVPRTVPLPAPCCPPARTAPVLLIAAHDGDAAPRAPAAPRSPPALSAQAPLTTVHSRAIAPPAAPVPAHCNPPAQGSGAPSEPTPVDEPCTRVAAAAATSLPAAADTAGAAAAPAGPPLQPPTGAAPAMGAGAAAFNFSAGGDAAGVRPALPRAKRPRALGSSTWTLPPCNVTVQPKNQERFWGEVRVKMEEVEECMCTHRPPESEKRLFSSADVVADSAGPPVSGVQLAPS